LVSSSPSPASHHPLAPTRKKQKKQRHLAPFFGGKREGKIKQKKVSTCIIPGMDTLELMCSRRFPGLLYPFFDKTLEANIKPYNESLKTLSPAIRDIETSFQTT